MIKLFFCVTKKHDTSIPDFRRHWHDQQVPLIENLANATGAVRQVYSVTLAVEQNERIQRLRGTRTPYDAVSEIWWDNARDLDRALDSPELNAVREHLFMQGQEFIDHAQSTLFFAQEEEVAATKGSLAT